MIIGLDVGGTNIDIVAIENNKVVDYKKFELGHDVLSSILTSLEEFITKDHISTLNRIVLSTTITTNAIVQNKLDKVGMIIENGIGANPDFLMCADANVLVDGYINNRGIEVKSFSPHTVEKAVSEFKKFSIRNVGIACKFSVRNPKHENEIYDIVKKHCFEFISLGHRISGKLNFPRRVFSTYLNSAVYSSFKLLYSAILEFLKEKNLPTEIVFIQKPDGGIINLENLKEFPIFSILSGPAASAQGGYILSKPISNAVIIDIGGTTTDISFVCNGQFVLEQYGATIGNYPTLVRAIYSRSVGIGGDSIVKVEDSISVGPETVKSYATDRENVVTFSDVLLYSTNSSCLDNKLQTRLMNLSKKVNMSLTLFCNEVLEIALNAISKKIKEGIEYINSAPVYTIQKLLYGEKFAPEKAIVIGGAADLIREHLEKKLKIRVEVPQYYMVANAIGCALGSVSREYNLIADTQQGKVYIPELNKCESVDIDFTPAQAKDFLINKIIEAGDALSAEEIEIIEENSFNMIRNLRYCGKIIKIKAQLKPKLQELK
ncbi:hydantoinase/oxoprolinase family protein [Caldicellulosiruptor naganoensis]|uniref:Hydantoinase n=1 Tax=Caldicellulosiruptor naganoensis TaxID=29324 RepID=A0ABY7BJ18_9FIRM|nr:hydantoinase/oxoprolinase family protein [Caldicellulosiruptor naganoensis]WAM32594.1 hydantoinase [Caldicellulosiruptor naganoensis]